MTDLGTWRQRRRREEGVIIASSQTVPQTGEALQTSDLVVPGLDILQREVAGAGDLAGCRQQTVRRMWTGFTSGINAIEALAACTDGPALFFPRPHHEHGHIQRMPDRVDRGPENQVLNPAMSVRAHDH